LVSRPVKQQLLDGYAALQEGDVDVSAAMVGDGLSFATAANPAQAAARQRLDRLKADPQWFQKLMAGEAEATAEYERLNQDLAS
jgi:hypothetical protein